MNTFKNSLKFRPQSSQFTEETGLLNVSKNVIVKKSDDNNYIEITNTNFTKPLTFKIPIQKESFSALYSYHQVEDLLDRYKLYSTEYKDLIKNYSIQEMKFLQQKFPNMVFNIKIRQKSEYSYKKKLNDIIESNSNRNLFLHDIIAERIVLSEFDRNRYPYNPESEEELRKDCFIISKALDDFRKKSFFKKIQEKNYMEHPKKNGYESLHIIMENVDNPDCLFETQIRTLEMENNSKTSGEIAHCIYKPRLLNDSSMSKLPLYSQITPFLDSNGNPLVLDLSTSESFYHFYGIKLEDYRTQINSVSNVIKDVKNRLYTKTTPVHSIVK